jgi:hypothetical protein
MFNKKGQGLQISTVILFILGVVILVILILGFTMGWQKIAPWLFSTNNVDTIVSQCQAACTTNSAYGFCVMNRTLKSPDVVEYKAIVGGKEVTIIPQGQVNGSCFYFATKTDVGSNNDLTKYKVAPCPGLSC